MKKSVCFCFLQSTFVWELICPVFVYFTFLTGPHLISFRPHARNVPLQASMTVTDGEYHMCTPWITILKELIHFTAVI